MIEASPYDRCLTYNERSISKMSSLLLCRRRGMIYPTLCVSIVVVVIVKMYDRAKR